MKNDLQIAKEIELKTITEIAEQLNISDEIECYGKYKAKIDLSVMNSEKENGKIEQQAEIEKEEVIFRLEVTQKLEKLQKKYYDEEASQKEKDEYALEAGKLMVKELLHNTKDNAGLL